VAGFKELIFQAVAREVFPLVMQDGLGDVLSLPVGDGLAFTPTVLGRAGQTAVIGSRGAMGLLASGLDIVRCPL
jgi:hypothetical protein